jgi:hypothetical protein
MKRHTNLGELVDAAHQRVGPNLVRRGLWLLPLALCLVFMVVVVLWAASNESRDRQALLRQLQTDATSVQVQMDARLDLERARLRDVALRLSTMHDAASVNLKGLPEVIAGMDRLWNRLVWLDADLRVLGARRSHGSRGLSHHRQTHCASKAAVRPIIWSSRCLPRPVCAKDGYWRATT